MNYTDLRGKTIFDFCTDRAILSKVTDHPDPLGSKEYIESCIPLVHAQMIQQLAKETNNHALLSAAKKLEKELWEEWNAACDEASKEGCIID